MLLALLIKFLFSLVSFVLQLLTIMIANLTRRYTNCDNITVDSIGTSGIDSVIAYGMADITVFAIGFLPFIGIAISVLEMIPVIGDFVDDIIWSLGFAATYIIINMINQDDMEKFCSTPFGGNLQDQIPFTVASITIPAIAVLNMFM